jgi:hypothetical protein
MQSFVGYACMRKTNHFSSILVFTAIVLTYTLSRSRVAQELCITHVTWHAFSMLYALGGMRVMRMLTMCSILGSSLCTAQLLRKLSLKLSLQAQFR